MAQDFLDRPLPGIVTGLILAGGAIAAVYLFNGKSLRTPAASSTAGQANANNANNAGLAAVASPLTGDGGWSTGLGTQASQENGLAIPGTTPNE
jgi:hypothetical protein